MEIKALWKSRNENVVILQFLRRQVSYSPSGHREAGNTVAICIYNTMIYEIDINDLIIENEYGK